MSGATHTRPTRLTRGLMLGIVSFALTSLVLVLDLVHATAAIR